jgi:hypothetical protein
MASSDHLPFWQTSPAGCFALATGLEVSSSRRTLATGDREPCPAGLFCLSRFLTQNVIGHTEKVTLLMKILDSDFSSIPDLTRASQAALQGPQW